MDLKYIYAIYYGSPERGNRGRDFSFLFLPCTHNLFTCFNKMISCLNDLLCRAHKLFILFKQNKTRLNDLLGRTHKLIACLNDIICHSHK